MTTFALIATYQVWENYGAHAWDGEGECPQYWKAKGGEEVIVCENLTLKDVTSLSSDDLRRMVENAAPTNDDFFTHDLIDYELVELSDSLIQKVKDFQESEKFDPYLHRDAYGVSFDLGITEYAAKWALERI